MKIQEYKPQYVLDIYTYDNSFYTLPETHFDKIKEVLNKDKFIELNGDLVACSSVKKVCKRLIKPKVDLNEIYRQESENKKPIPKKLIEKLMKQAKTY